MKTASKQMKSYTVTDGTLVLNLESDGGKWLVVTCPFDPELVTQARTIDEAFAMAYDAKKLLDACRMENTSVKQSTTGRSNVAEKNRATGRRQRLVKA